MLFRFFSFFCVLPSLAVPMCKPYQCVLVFTAFQAVRCQVLEYFFRQREVLREDHILFSFEQSMVFSKAEFGLIDQVSMTSMGHVFSLFGK